MDNVKQLDDLHEALASTESELRDAREALARVEADKRQLELIVNSHANMRDIAQAQLAEAVGLGKALHSACVNLLYGGYDRITELGGDCDPVSKMEAENPAMQEWKAFLARHAQAEQQEAQPTAEQLEALRRFRDTYDGGENYDVPVYVMRSLAALGLVTPNPNLHQRAFSMNAKGYAALEAQGAQAEPANFGQELEAFEKWRHTQADSLRRCGYPDGADAFIRLGSVQWAGWQARAALATQPAVRGAEHE